MRGGKYSAFEAGTRVPFIVQWPAKIKAGTVSEALFSQVDLYASLAALTGQKITDGNAPDSFNNLNALLGAKTGRKYVVEQSLSNTLGIVQGNWKYIEPSNGRKISQNTNIELGNDLQPQLYNLKEDIGERNNLAEKHPEKVKELAEKLRKIKEG